MTPSANIASLVVLAGFGLAAGIAVLYHYMTTSDEHGCHQNSPSPSSARSSRSPSRERRRLRAISPPPRETQTINRVAPTSNLSNRVRRRAEEISSCRICSKRMPTNAKTIRLDCSHVFHDECYTIWRYAVVMNNPHANLCPSC